MVIQREDPGTGDIHALLLEHLADMRLHSPPESVHALDLDGLRAPEITFWSVRRDDGVLLGCGALKQLDVECAEIKSMKTAAAHLRKGVAQLMLDHIISVAKARGLKTLLLETGSPDAFIPARKLYVARGFIECQPFADYQLDPFSVFMSRDLTL